jgi:hypothetical protein
MRLFSSAGEGLGKTAPRPPGQLAIPSLPPFLLRLGRERALPAALQPVIQREERVFFLAPLGRRLFCPIANLCGGCLLCDLLYAKLRLRLRLHLRICLRLHMRTHLLGIQHTFCARHREPEKQLSAGTSWRIGIKDWPSTARHGSAAQPCRRTTAHPVC